jgi:hypothetical protein
LIGVLGGQIGLGHLLVAGLIQVLSPHKRGDVIGHPFAMLQISEFETIDPSGHIWNPSLGITLTHVFELSVHLPSGHLKGW